MAEKRRGLGRGLGALIPSGSGDARPVDVFFPGASIVAPVKAEESGTASAEPGDTSTVEAPEHANGSVTAVDPHTPADPRSTDGAGSEGTERDGTVSEGTGDAVARSSASSSVDNGAAPSDAAPDSATPDSVAGATARQDGTDGGLLPVPGAYFAEVPVGSVRTNPRQPRTVFDEDALAELIGSIREVGVLQPVVVREVEPDPDQPEIRFELIMGERRWRATQGAGLATIPAIVRQTEDADLLRDALLENLHRSQLNVLEEAAAYQQLLDDFGCTHDELAQRIHRSRPQISNTLRLLRLPPLVQRRVAAGVLSAGHARALLGLTDAAAMERLAQRIVAEGLSVRSTEEIVSLGGDPERPVSVRRARPGDRNAALDDLAGRLSDKFDTRVKIALGKSKGRLTVEFASVQDLNRILSTLSPDDPGLLR